MAEQSWKDGQKQYHELLIRLRVADSGAKQSNYIFLLLIGKPEPAVVPASL